MAVLGMVVHREQDDAGDHGRRKPPPRIEHDHGRCRDKDDGALHCVGPAAVDGVSRLRIKSSVSLSFNGTAL